MAPMLASPSMTSRARPSDPPVTTRPDTLRGAVQIAGKKPMYHVEKTGVVLAWCWDEGEARGIAETVEGEVVRRGGRT